KTLFCDNWPWCLLLTFLDKVALSQLFQRFQHNLAIQTFSQFGYRRNPESTPNNGRCLDYLFFDAGEQVNTSSQHALDSIREAWHGQNVMLIKQGIFGRRGGTRQIAKSVLALLANVPGAICFDQDILVDQHT